MAKRGRPRKSGARQPNGQLRRPTLAQLQENEYQRRMSETAVVAAQPHRAWAKDPRDPKLATALGRFCVFYAVRSELYEAGVEWANTYRRLLAAKGCPDPLHQSTLGRGGDGPSDATVDAWERDVERVENALRPYGSGALVGVRHLCMDNADLPAEAAADAIVGLRVLAVTLGRLPKGAHPFARPVEKRRAA
jgi:hypothetical protein